MSSSVRASSEAFRLHNGKTVRVCASCFKVWQRRYASSAASAPSAFSEPAPVPFERSTPRTLISTAPHQVYDVKASVVLSRPPQITRNLSSFEKAFYLYQKRLNERLALSFTPLFYFPKGTPAEREWKRKLRLRRTPARDIGVYKATGPESWNDEVLIGSVVSEPEAYVDAILKETVVEEDASDLSEQRDAEKDKQKQIIEKPMPRVTEADRLNDVRSLNRALTRTLYLLVRGANGKWEFPTSSIIERESLHRAAERVLVQGAGPNMNTWLVGHAPVAHLTSNYSEPSLDDQKKTEKLGEKIFFMKARIMAGRPELKNNKLGLAEYKWLAKEEVQYEVTPSYWRAVRNMLVEQ